MPACGLQHRTPASATPGKGSVLKQTAKPAFAGRYGWASFLAFLHSMTNWMAMAKQPSPPPSITPAVPPRNVANPIGSISCHGTICRKKSGVRRPDANPNSPPMTMPAKAQAVTARKVRFHVIECKWPNACVSDRRQRETVSGVKAGVEAASCSLDAMVGP